MATPDMGIAALFNQGNVAADPQAQGAPAPVQETLPSPTTVPDMMGIDSGDRLKEIKKLARENPEFRDLMSKLPPMEQSLGVTPTPHAPLDELQAAAKDPQWSMNQAKINELQGRLSKTPQQLEQDARQQINQGLGIDPNTPNSVEAAARNIIDSRYNGKLGKATRFLTDMFKAPGAQFTTDVAYQQAQKAYDEQRKQVHDVILQERANDATNLKTLHESAAQQMQQYKIQSDTAKMQEAQRHADIEAIQKAGQLVLGQGKLDVAKNSQELQAAVAAYDRQYGNKPEDQAFKAITADLMGKYNYSEARAKSEALRMMYSAQSARQAIVNLGSTRTDTSKQDPVTGAVTTQSSNMRQFMGNPLTQTFAQAYPQLVGQQGQAPNQSGAQQAPQPTIPAASAPRPVSAAYSPEVDDYNPQYRLPSGNGKAMQKQHDNEMQAVAGSSQALDTLNTALKAKDPTEFMGPLMGSGFVKALQRSWFTGDNAASAERLALEQGLPQQVLGTIRGAIGSSSRINNQEIQAFSKAMPSTTDSYQTFVKASALNALRAQVSEAHSRNPNFKADMPKILYEADRIAKLADKASKQTDHGFAERSQMNLRSLTDLNKIEIAVDQNGQYHEAPKGTPLRQGFKMVAP